MDHDVVAAIEVLKSGGVILYPTDTIWGIGCDATNETAIDRIYQLKRRTDTKSMLVLVDTLTRIEQYVQEIPEIAFQLLEVADKPMTIIYPGARNLAKNLIGQDGSIGIRLVKDEFCIRLLSRIKRPLVSTSANLSGQSSPLTYKDIVDEIKSGVDYVVKWRQNDHRSARPSSIVKVYVNGVIEILRK